MAARALSSSRSYVGFLSSADILISTADSANMLSEAASTGAPLFVLGASSARGKARALVELLEARGVARRAPEAETSGDADAQQGGGGGEEWRRRVPTTGYDVRPLSFSKCLPLWRMMMRMIDA